MAPDCQLLFLYVLEREICASAVVFDSDHLLRRDPAGMAQAYVIQGREKSGLQENGAGGQHNSKFSSPVLF